MPMPMAEVHRGERRTGIETVPAEPEEQTAANGNCQIVRKHGAAAVALEFAANSRPKHDAARQGDPPADRVNDRRTSEVVEVHVNAAGQEVGVGGYCPRPV